MAEKFTVGLIQMSCSLDPRENFAKAEARIQEAAKRGAQIICLQELFRSQYFCREENSELFELAEAIPGPSTEALSKLARSLKVVIIGSLFERRAAGIYHNTAVAIDADGALLGKYRKMHIPDDPLYYEKFYFTPGDLGFPNFDTRFARIGVLVCWDQWYPEGARLTALQGASILFHPTAIGWHPAEKAEFGEAQHDAWRTIQRAHAIANGVYVGVVNRVGFETGDIRGRRPQRLPRAAQGRLADPARGVRQPRHFPGQARRHRGEARRGNDQPRGCAQRVHRAVLVLTRGPVWH